MEFNTNNIISYIESQKSYQVFNIDYTQKEINCIKNFNILYPTDKIIKS